MENYNKIFNKLPLPCLLLKSRDGDFIIGGANEAYLKFAKRQREMITGVSFSTALPSGVLYSDLLPSLKEVMAAGEPKILDHLRIEREATLDRLPEENYVLLELIPVQEEKLTSCIIVTFNDRTSEIRNERQKQLAEKRLDENLSSYEYFVQQNPDGLYSLDLFGNFMNLNDGFAKMADLPIEELQTQNFFSFCASYDRDCVYDHFLKATQGSKEQFKADFISAKGRKMVLLISLVPFEIEGEITGIYGIAKDITEKLAAEHAALEWEKTLQLSRQKFKALVQEGSDLIAILDVEANYLFASESSTSILGIPTEEYNGKNAFDFIHPEDQDWMKEKFEDLHPKKQITIPPFRFKDGAGGWRWLESKATNLLHVPGVEGIVVNSIDITQAYLQRKEIDQLNERYRLASKATDDLIYDWDLVNNSIIRNKVFWKNYGFNKKEARTPGPFWFNRIYKKDKQRVINSFYSALEDRTQKKWTEEYRFLKKDGSMAYLIDRAYILRDPDGKAIRIVGANQDVTDSKKFLKKIKKQNAILKEVAWEQAHILRAPIVRLQAMMNYFKNENYDIWDRDELIDLITNTVNELDDIVLHRINKLEKQHVKN